MKGTIYKIVNHVDGKIYIGQTITSLEKRLYSHARKGSHCLYLRNAILKYGIDSFTIEGIETIEELSPEILYDKLDILEKELIAQMNCVYPNGYNLTHGGRRGRRSKDAVQRSAEGHWKPIKCNETGQQWSSVKECANFFQVKVEAIHRVLRGVRKRFRWKYTFSYIPKQS